MENIVGGQALFVTFALIACGVASGMLLAWAVRFILGEIYNFFLLILAMVYVVYVEFMRPTVHRSMAFLKKSFNYNRAK